MFKALFGKASVTALPTRGVLLARTTLPTRVILLARMRRSAHSPRLARTRRSAYSRRSVHSRRSTCSRRFACSHACAVFSVKRPGTIAGMALSHFTTPRWIFKAFLLLAAAIWGLGTVVIKDIVDAVPPAWLVAIRFFFAGIILAVFILPRLRRRLDASHLRVGALLGVILFFEYWLNSLGLTDTTASKSAFLTSCYCVLVPFLGWLFLRRRPTRFNVMAALVCVVGVGFISLSSADTLTLGFGDGITLVSALFVALEVITVARFASTHDILVLTCVQFFVAGLLGFGGALAVEPMPDFARLDPGVWAGLAYLAAGASWTCPECVVWACGTPMRVSRPRSPTSKRRRRAAVSATASIRTSRDAPCAPPWKPAS